MPSYHYQTSGQKGRILPQRRDQRESREEGNLSAMSRVELTIRPLILIFLCHLPDAATHTHQSTGIDVNIKPTWERNLLFSTCGKLQMITSYRHFNILDPFGM
jgi:hypothetical protein